MKRFIGLGNQYHDASVAVFNEDGELVFFSQTERLSRIKRDANIPNLNTLFTGVGMRPLSKDDVIYTSSPDFFFRDISCLSNSEPSSINFKQLQDMFMGYDVRFIGHHIAHAMCSFMFRDTRLDEACIYISLDGFGKSSRNTNSCFSTGSIAENVFEEVSSDMSFDYSPHYRLNPLPMPYTNSGEVAGKIMGLAGSIPEEKTRYLSISEVNNSILRFKAEGLSEGVAIEYASHYNSFIKDAKSVVLPLLDPHSNSKSVIVGGGAFLALELNTFIREHGFELVFAPPINDSGISLGCAAAAYFQTYGVFPSPILTPFLQSIEAEHQNNYQTPQQAANILVDLNTPIGLIIGKGEAGPRALGHRSLLAVPTINNKTLVSETIKGREAYRPVAPIVTDRDFSNLFNGPAGRYMQYRNVCKEAAVRLTPGIVHDDSSSRVQVLSYVDNPWLYETLVEVGKKTGAECLINTSLNGRGKPIVNSVNDVHREMETKYFRLISFN